jgi:hypothetical protein
MEIIEWKFIHIALIGDIALILIYILDSWFDFLIFKCK